MPWTPLKYTEEIFVAIKNLGYTTEVPTKVLFAEIMRATGLVRSETIKNVIKSFVTLGYLSEIRSGFFMIRYWKDLEI